MTADLHGGYSSGTTDNCYVDTPSVCDAQNAVSCAEPGGSEDVCCPRLTRCVPGRAAAVDSVRCEIAYTDLNQLIATVANTSSVFPTGLTSSSASTATPALATPASISTTPTQYTTASPAATPLALSGRAIAGIGIGALAVIGLGGAGAYYFLRHRWIAKYGQNNGAVNHDDNADGNRYYGLQGTHPNWKFPRVDQQPSGQTDIVELPSVNPGPQELDGTGR